MVSKFISLFLGISTPGKRSLNNPEKTSISWKAILGILKSLRALISSAASATVASALLNPPATTKTDLIALSPQS